MSSSIWTRCAGDRHIRRLRGAVWRVVESQYVNSTRQLVDSDAEQELLERMLESSKGPRPTEPEFDGLHYLLATPFRYPPLRYGSRFGSRHERGIWYGARRRETALAEFAYYRFVFLAGTRAELSTLTIPVSPFRIRLDASRGVDLTAAPFAARRAAISSRTSYRATQKLGAAMREAGVEAFLWISARDPRGGTNVGIFTPTAFADLAPEPPEHWRCVVSEDAVEFRKRDVFREVRFRFERREFLVRGRLPTPAT